MEISFTKIKKYERIFFEKIFLHNFSILIKIVFFFQGEIGSNCDMDSKSTRFTLLLLAAVICQMRTYELVYSNEDNTRAMTEQNMSIATTQATTRTKIENTPRAVTQSAIQTTTHIASEARVRAEAEAMVNNDTSKMTIKVRKNSTLEIDAQFLITSHFLS